jgi:putative glutamine amidotransferase
MPAPPHTVRIGITAHLEMVVPEDGDGSLHYVVSAPYVKAVRKAGALPVLLPVVDPHDAAAMLDIVDALIVTGGADVDPTNYNTPADPRLGPTDPVRDAADLAITSAAVDGNVPMLATCRGIQVLNVAMGGTLVQHVDDHMRVDMYNEDVHDVEIDPASRLATILGTEAMGVNSMHHQVIDRLGPGVRAVARNHDGHIEAIEIDAAPAVLGVQWHPELLRHRSDHLALFEDLVHQVIARREKGVRHASR